MSPEPVTRPSAFELQVGQEIPILGSKVKLIDSYGSAGVCEVFVGECAGSKVIIKKRKNTQDKQEATILSRGFANESAELAILNQAEGLTFDKGETLADRIQKAFLTSSSRLIIASLYADQDLQVQEFAPPEYLPNQSSDNRLPIAAHLLSAMALCYDHNIALGDFDPSTKTDRIRVAISPDNKIDFKLIDFNGSRVLTDPNAAKKDFLYLIGHITKLFEAAPMTTSGEIKVPFGSFSEFSKSIAELSSSQRELLVSLYNIYSSLTGNGRVDATKAKIAISKVKQVVKAISVGEFTDVNKILSDGALDEYGATPHLLQFAHLSNPENSNNPNHTYQTKYEEADKNRFANRTTMLNQGLLMGAEAVALQTLTDEFIETEPNVFAQQILRTIKQIVEQSPNRSKNVIFAGNLPFLYTNNLTKEKLTELETSAATNNIASSEFVTLLTLAKAKLGISEPTPAQANETSKKKRRKRPSNRIMPLGMMEKWIEQRNDSLRLREVNDSLIKDNTALKEQVAQLENSATETTQKNEEKLSGIHVKMGELETSNSAMEARVGDQEKELQILNQQKRVLEASLTLEQEKSGGYLAQMIDMESKILELEEKLEQK